MPQQEVQLDSGILQPHQLSDKECEILLLIEDRLREVERQPESLEEQRCGRRTESQEPEFKAEPLAATEKRYQRVLLLDGVRGTGKTSFILTLINRWHYAAGLPKAEKWELDGAQAERVLSSLRNARLKSDAPEHIRVLRNLDFDPLPPRMPVLAAIVQAWRPLVELYDTETFGGEDLCDEDAGRRLMDSWHSLFRVAATGWSELPRSKGLIEQVLDREEQVKDWQHLRESWLWFVEKVIATGRRLSKHTLQEPAFVIVIDDVDLQVERVRELLPALRLLSHPNVFFIVAADSGHMIEMLKLDYFGQQQRVAESRADGLNAAEKNRWSNELAFAAFEKAFPTRNQWSLQRLSLIELLSYPPSPVGVARNDTVLTLAQVLNAITRKRGRSTAVPEDDERSRCAGAAIERLARAADEASITLRTLSYRSVEQLWQAVQDVPRATDDQKTEVATSVLARLVSDPDAPPLLSVKLSPTETATDGKRVKMNAPGESTPGQELQLTRTIFVPAAGQLAALYRPVLTDPGGEDHVVVSAQPDFVSVLPDGTVSMLSAGTSRVDFTARLIASTLQELNFPLSTATTWDIRLAFAWTEWPRLNGATFAWPLHTHPRPDELLEETSEKWSKYLEAIGAEGEKLNIRERHAYAWLYYERARYFARQQEKASGRDPISLAKELSPDWAKLIGALNMPERTPRDEQKRWAKFTKPFLARPEIGLDPDMQKFLLSGPPLNVAALKRQRERAATEALLVGALRQGKVRAHPSDAEVDELLKEIEAHHEDAHGKPSPWARAIEFNRRGSSQVKSHGSKRTTRRAGS